MTVSDIEFETKQLKEYLQSLYTLRMEYMSGKAIKMMQKSDSLLRFSSLAELSTEIRRTEEKLLALCPANLVQDFGCKK